MDRDLRWRVVSRSHQFETERRIALFRLVAIGLFYSIHLVGFLTDDAPDERTRWFHFYATILALTWIGFGIFIQVALARRVFPRWTGTAASLTDLALLTATASLGSQANSPLVFVLFLLIVAAGLRFDLMQVWVTSAATVIAYLALLAVGDPGSWFDDRHQTPMVHQAMVLGSLVLCGVLCGQIARRVRSLTLDPANRPTGGGASLDTNRNAGDS